LRRVGGFLFGLAEDRPEVKEFLVYGGGWRPVRDGRFVLPVGEQGALEGLVCLAVRQRRVRRYLRVYLPFPAFVENRFEGGIDIVPGCSLVRSLLLQGVLR